MQRLFNPCAQERQQLQQYRAAYEQNLVLFRQLETTMRQQEARAITAEAALARSNAQILKLTESQKWWINRAAILATLNSEYVRAADLTPQQKQAASEAYSNLANQLILKDPSNRTVIESERILLREHNLLAYQPSVSEIKIGGRTHGRKSRLRRTN